MMNVVSEMLHWANRWSNILSKFSHLVALAANPWGDKRKKCWRSERQTPKPHTGSNCHCFHHNQKRLMLIYGQSCASASHGKVCGMCVTHSSMWHSFSLANVLKYEKFLFPVDTWSATAKVKRCLCFFSLLTSSTVLLNSDAKETREEERISMMVNHFVQKRTGIS